LYALYGAGEDPSYVNDAGGEVWMYRKGQKVQLFDRAANQVGPQHPTVLAATMWAFANGWTNSSTPAWLNDGQRDEARR
jgi:hypothetical protein